MIFWFVALSCFLGKQSAVNASVYAVNRAPNKKIKTKRKTIHKEKITQGVGGAGGSTPPNYGRRQGGMFEEATIQQRVR